MKRPKDMTSDELEALPIGAPDEGPCDDPLFMKVFGRSRYRGNGVSGDDLLGFESKDGYFYRLHEAADGTWFRTKGLL